MLDADELINGSIGHDLAGVTTDHAATQARVMASLAAVSDAARRGLPGDSLSPGSGLTGGSSIIVKTLLAVVVAGGLGLGIYGLWPHDNPAKLVPAVEQVQVPVVPQAVTDDTMPSEVVPAPITPAINESTATNEPVVRAQSDAHRSPQDIMPHRSPQKETVPAQTDRIESPATVESTTREVQRDIPVRRKDSVHLKIDVKKE
jgi:hypothetical protein